MSGFWLLPVAALIVGLFALWRGLMGLRTASEQAGRQLDLAAQALRDLTDQTPEAGVLVRRLRGGSHED